MSGAGFNFLSLLFLQTSFQKRHGLAQNPWRQCPNLPRAVAFWGKQRIRPLFLVSGLIVVKELKMVARFANDHLRGIWAGVIEALKDVTSRN